MSIRCVGWGYSWEKNVPLASAAESQFAFPNTVKTLAHNIVLVTAPDLKTARHLAALALEERAAACVNLLPQIESHYWWQGKLESSTEILMVFKTLKTKLNTLEKLILKHHPYDTAEFVSFPITDGNQRYLQWITDTCQSKITRDDLAAKLRSA